MYHAFGSGLQLFLVPCAHSLISCLHTHYLMDTKWTHTHKKSREQEEEEEWKNDEYTHFGVHAHKHTSDAFRLAVFGLVKI